MQLNTVNVSEREKNNKLVFLSACMLMFTFAFSATMISPILSEIINHFNLRLSQGGLIFTFQSIGGILIIILLGFISDYYSKHKIIIIGFSLYVISLYLISITPLFNLLLLLFFVLGIGTRIVDTISNALISQQFVTKKGVYLNLLHTSFGIGALLGPLYSRSLLDIGFKWQAVFKFLSIGSISALFFFIIVTKNLYNAKEKYNNKTKENLLILLQDKQVWILCIVMFLYVGHQSGFMIWLVMYLETYLQTEPLLASLSLSIYWVGIIISRLTFSCLTSKYSNINLIKWSSLIGGLILIIGISLKIPLIIIITLSISGLITGAFIPLLIDIASSWYPNNTGAITSILYLSLNLSIMFFPWIIGIIAETFTFQMGIMFAALILPLIYFVSYFMEHSS